MRYALAALCSLLVCAGAMPGAEEKELPIPNGGFEGGLDGWKAPADGGLCSVSTEQVFKGKHALKVVDTSEKEGSSLTSARVPIRGAGLYQLRGQVYSVSGDGLGLYTRIYDKDGKDLTGGEAILLGLGGSDKKWRAVSRDIFAPEGAAFLELWIHSYSIARVEAYLDELRFVDMGDAAQRRPWEPLYKIRPDEKDRLTEADVIGPDGIVYPNWTKCGVQGGLPQVEVVTRIEEHGGRADDEADDADALEKACRAAGEKGGGAVLLAAGTYHLDRPISVAHAGVVIRGQGMGKTKLVFRYKVGGEGAAFYAPKAGEKVGPNTLVELHCVPQGLTRMAILLDGQEIAEWKPSTHSGNTFNMDCRGRALLAKKKDGGECTLKGVGEYKDGKKRECSINVTLDPGFHESVEPPFSRGAITFQGRGATGERLKLAQDGKRGSRTLELERTAGLRVGDCVAIEGPATERWKKLTRNVCQWGMYRRYEALIEKIDDNRVTLNQPLRIEFPVIDGSFVQKTIPTQRCGIEDLHIEQTENLWISSVFFRNAWNCWARGVKVHKCGRFPIYAVGGKWCEFRDCIFDDAWFKGGGGTAYAGWEYCCDCLMENIETFKLRHAPQVQWAASGCVIRKSVFHESDGQWHSGWTNENLFEQCVIESKTGNGGYGYGLWASPPEDSAHGPNGPRNVVYNCDVSSPKDGLWMGGMNENWLILYNRFVVANGHGVFAKTCSFDHIIRGNVFVLKDGQSAALRLATPDCVGIELIGNTVCGGKLFDGSAKLEVESGNRLLPLPSGDAPRPQPVVPSIYEWQKANRK